MHTVRMQAKLESVKDHLKLGESYRITPSDCSDNGYDIAEKYRDDESGEYIIEGRTYMVRGELRINSGPYVSYIVSSIDPAAQPKNEADCVGKQVYALVARMGGKFATIHALSVWEVTPRGTMRYVEEKLHCVANIAQTEYMRNMTKLTGYVSGRPSYKDVCNQLLAGKLHPVN